MKNFYWANRALCHVLFLLTSLTFLVTSFLWWQARHVVEPVSKVPTVLIHFSERFTLDDYTRQYAYEAKYIHDLESYPKINKAFFDSVVAIPTAKTIAFDLVEVREASQKQTEASKQQVFSTSYYIGNLLVRPDTTLHQLLLSASRPATTELIETALADVRAGLVKIQNVYDVASPLLYASSTELSNPLYTTAPSFPSLTVGESAMVFLILGSLDSTWARQYEEQARQYAAAVYSTGAHFRGDITAALTLAELYLDIMQTDSAYAPLFQVARAEWTNKEVVSVPLSYLSDSPFIFKNFPYNSLVTVSAVENHEYHIAGSGEELEGSVMVSLIDERLPEPGARLYQIDVTRGEILPFALDMENRHSAKLGGAVGIARYEDNDTFSFVTGDKSTERTLFKPATAKLHQRDGDAIETFDITLGNFSYQDSVQLLTDRSWLFVERAKEDPTSGALYIGSIENNLQRQLLLGTGTSPSLVPSDTVLYVDGGITKSLSLHDKKTESVSGVVPFDVKVGTRTLEYFSKQRILLTIDSSVDQATLVPNSVLTLYTLKLFEGRVEAELRYTFTMHDYLVQSAELSLSGRYVAVGGTETLGKRAPSLLIFDTFNGIIKKEVDLAAFNANFILLDGWLVL